MRQKFFSPQIFMANIALILAGGFGARTHQDIPKQFLTINDRPIIIYTLEAFQRHPEIDAIAVVCLGGWENFLQAYARQFNISKLKHIVIGGENGHYSARNGVFELEKNYSPEDIVLIHDSNRPLVSAEIISDCIVTTRKYGCATPVTPSLDAMFETSDGLISSGHYPRNNIKRGQTPNGFFLGKICEIYRKAEAAGIKNSSGPSVLMMDMGEPTHLYFGSAKNFKITTVEDIEIFKALLVAKKTEWLK